MIYQFVYIFTYEYYIYEYLWSMLKTSQCRLTINAKAIKNEHLNL